MISSYLVDAILLLVAAVLAVPLFQALRLGAVPGFLVAGVVVGPHGFGLISNITEISHLAEIGVVFLLFVIGIELKPSRLWQMRRLVFGAGVLQVTFTGLLLGLVCYMFLDIPLRATILIGPALALSSTAFVLQLLVEQKLLTSVYGRTSISVLLLQDLAVVPLLALVPLLAMPELSIGEDIGLALAESLLILVLVILLGRYLLHPVLHRVAMSGNPEIFTASAILIVLGTAYATEHAGLSMAMGAFLAGLLISDSSYKHQVMAEIQPFRGLLLGLFFMTMGISLNINLLLESPLPSIGLTVILLALKAAVLFPIALLFRLNPKNSLAVALVMAQSGEFALVLFSLARHSGLVTEHLFQWLLLVVLLSMLITPLLADLARRVVRSQLGVAKTEDLGQPPPAPIVIAGFGRVGHRIGEILSMAGKTYIALDANVDVVQRERAAGHPVFYGDARNAEVLKGAGASDANIIIVTLNDTAAVEQVVASLRKRYPDKSIFARGQTSEQCRNLRNSGATDVVSENFEASVELARMTLVCAGFDGENRERILADFRQNYRTRMHETAEGPL